MIMKNIPGACPGMFFVHKVYLLVEADVLVFDVGFLGVGFAVRKLECGDINGEDGIQESERFGTFLDG